MGLPFFEIKSSRKLENAIFISILLFLFKIIYPSFTSFFGIVINELLIFSVMYFWMLYAIDFIHSKSPAPLSVVLNSGILNALIFFIISLSSSLFSELSDLGSSTNFVYSIFTTFIAFVFIGSVIYIISAFRELFYLRQQRDPSTYFNTMLVFFGLTFVSNLFTRLDPSLDYLKNSFYVVSIVLISFNSLRVAWIAFLVKKQKVYLLIISIVLSILFGFNFALTLESNIVQQLIMNFSPGLHTILNLVMIYGTIYFGVIFFTALFHLPTAEAFDRKAEEVASLMDLSKLITQVFDFKELADTVTAITTKVCNSDSAWLVTHKDGNYELSSINNIGYVEAEKITNSLLVESAYQIDEVRTINDHPIKIRIKTDIRTFNYKSVAIAPLKVHNETNGFLFAARKHNFVFDDDDKKAVGAFADYAAVALENAKHIEESLEKERLEKELDVAREIQYKILPTETPILKNMEISALFVPAFEVGGDYYDFFELRNNKLGFVVADVSGKGISAAFIMAEVKGIFESLAKLIESPKELLITANEILKNSLEKKSFVTAIYGIVDTETGSLNFARVGHTPLLHIHGNRVEQLTPPGIGLGLDFGPNFSNNIVEKEIQLNNDDIVVLYTDGITESLNGSYEEYGYGRFEKTLLENSRKSLIDLSNEVMKSLTVFSQDASQHDDITLVLFKWHFNK